MCFTQSRGFPAIIIGHKIAHILSEEECQDNRFKAGLETIKMYAFQSQYFSQTYRGGDMFYSSHDKDGNI